MKSVVCAVLALILSARGAIEHARGGARALAEPAARRGGAFLRVQGEGFRFEVTEPAGWHADTGHADALRCDVLFYRLAGALEDADAIGVIRVRLHHKVSEDLRSDMAIREAYYRRQFPRLELRQLTAFHPGDRVCAEELSVQGRLHEYLAYINPGPRDPVLFSVALSSGRLPASEADLGAFQEVVHSLAVVAK